MYVPSIVVTTAQSHSFALVDTVSVGSISTFSSTSDKVYLFAVQASFGLVPKYLIAVESLNSDKYYLKAPLRVVLSDFGDEFIAEFEEAEIAVSESTAFEALQWLKDSIVSSYEIFSGERNNLGPVPTRQLHVLEKYIGEKRSA